MSATRLGLTVLEAREVPAAFLMATLDLNYGVLRVEGTEEADTIQLVQSDGQMWVEGVFIEVTDYAGVTGLQATVPEVVVDRVIVDALGGNDLVFGVNWYRSFNGSIFRPHILAGDGDDVVFGGSEFERIDGGAGDDYLDGGGGGDVIDGQEGSDQVYGGEGHDYYLYGGLGDDTVDGGDGGDRLTGADGNDVLTGGDGTDTLLGEAGNDTLHGDSGELLDGGVGYDAIWRTWGPRCTSGSSGSDRPSRAGCPVD
jgi:Ca2+-binding RTX toxin-like protein